MSKGPGWKFVRETILGRRGLLKLNSLWLPLGIALLDPSASSVPNPLLRFFLLIAAVAGWILASTSANDFSERAEDRAAGKTRWMGDLPDSAARAMPFLFTLAGMGALVLARAPLGPIVVYTAASAIGLAYSLKPFRLKERGAWGLAAYALSCAAAYAALPWMWFGGGFPAIAVPATAVFLDKWVNLHFHQIVDYDADAKLAIRTYAVRAGTETARRTLRPATAAACLALAAAAAYAAWRIPGKAGIAAVATVGTLGLAALHTVIVRRRPCAETDLSRELSWIYLGLTLGVFRALPLVVFWEAARRTPSLLPALAVVALMLAADWISSFRYRYE